MRPHPRKIRKIENTVLALSLLIGNAPDVPVYTCPTRNMRAAMAVQALSRRFNLSERKVFAND
jgi:hypothetical protein